MYLIHDSIIFKDKETTRSSCLYPQSAGQSSNNHQENRILIVRHLQDNEKSLIIHISFYCSRKFKVMTINPESFQSFQSNQSCININ